MSNTAAIPTIITTRDLYERAGANATPNNVTFEHRQFDGTPQYRENPIGSIDAYDRAVREDYEWIERTETYTGFTKDEISVALAEVMGRFGEGLSKITRRGAFDRPSTRTVTTGIDIRTGEKSTAVVAEGAVNIPGFLGDNPWIAVGLAGRDGTPVLQATVVRCDQSKLEGLFQLVRDWANSNSIYVNQAIDTGFNFLDFSAFDIRSVAQTVAVQTALKLHVLNPMRCGAPGKINSKLGISTKSGLLFYGPPGGGKTMIVTLGIKMFLMERIGTVIVVDPSHGVDGFKRAHQIATRMMSAGHMVMVVMEDMEMLAANDRAGILDILDGSEVKSARRIILGTTNFVEKIDRAMIRPGRFDDVVHCDLPDRQAFEHLLRIMLEREVDGELVSLLDEDVDFDAAWRGQPMGPDGEYLEDADPVSYFEGFSFAFISGAVENILRSAALDLGADGDVNNITVTTRHLQAAALSKRDHHNMMSLTPVTEPPTLDAVFSRLVAEGNEVEINYGEIEGTVDSVVEHRMNGAHIKLETESGKAITGNLNTN